jgi:signal transduction histidine kinase
VRADQGHYQGEGIGLSIVKQFMDELGGGISLKSEVGQGTTFTLLLPVSPV